MSAERVQDILIAGGGVAGLYLDELLEQHQDLNVILIDPLSRRELREEMPYDGQRALVLQESSVRALGFPYESSDLIHRIKTDSLPLSTIGILQLFYQTKATLDPFIIVPYGRLVSHLRRQVSHQENSGVQVLPGVVSGVIYDRRAPKLSVQLREEALCADMLIDSSGPTRAVLSRLDPPAEAKKFPQLCTLFGIYVPHNEVTNNTIFADKVNGGIVFAAPVVGGEADVLIVEGDTPRIKAVHQEAMQNYSSTGKNQIWYKAMRELLVGTKWRNYLGQYSPEEVFGTMVFHYIDASYSLVCGGMRDCVVAVGDAVAHTNPIFGTGVERALKQAQQLTNNILQG